MRRACAASLGGSSLRERLSLDRKRREGAARGGAGIGAEMRRGAGDGMAS